MFLRSRDDDALALIESSSQTRLSYRDLSASVGAAASDLAGDRKRLIFLAGRRQIASVVAYLAAIEAGHAVLWIDPALASVSFDRLVRAYRPELVVHGSTRPSGARPDGYIDDRHPILGGLWRADATAGAPPIHPDLACLLATSGSTGSVRLVRLRRASLVANADAIVRALGLSHADVAITSLPIAHAFGLSVLNSHLAAGAALVLDESNLLQPDFWRAVHDERVTSLAGVPLTFEMLRRLDSARILPAGVNAMSQAGGRLAPDHVAFFRDLMDARGGSFRVMYGQTEATARISVWPALTPLDKVGSVGCVIPGGDVRIDAATGEIWYRGPNVMMGYAETRDDLARAGELSELPNGDLGYLDSDGFLFVTGRTKRIAKIAGCRVNLDEVEALLEGMSAAAIEDAGRLHVFVERPRGADFLGIATRLSQRLALDLSLVRVAGVESLPRSSAGKILYTALQGSAGPATDVTRP